jgi:hypothetical protein
LGKLCLIHHPHRIFGEYDMEGDNILLAQQGLIIHALGIGELEG